MPLRCHVMRPQWLIKAIWAACAQLIFSDCCRAWRALLLKFLLIWFQFFRIFSAIFPAIFIVFLVVLFRLWALYFYFNSLAAGSWCTLCSHTIILWLPSERVIQNDFGNILYKCISVNIFFNKYVYCIINIFVCKYIELSKKINIMTFKKEKNLWYSDNFNASVRTSVSEWIDTMHATLH